MKLLGRLLLFAVGGVLLYLSITSIVANYNVIQSQGWENFFTADTGKAVLEILTQVFYTLCGLYAIYIGLKGTSTFISFVAAVILIVIVVFKTIDFTKSDVEKNFKNIMDLVLSALMPGGFAIGIILLTIGRGEKSK